jgi:hypothetical protein
MCAVASSSVTYKLTWIKGVLIRAGITPDFAVQLLCLPKDILQQRILPTILAEG